MSESGGGVRTLPLLLSQFALKKAFHNCSSKPFFRSQARLQVAVSHQSDCLPSFRRPVEILEVKIL